MLAPEVKLGTQRADEELAALEAGEIDPASFPHLEHVRLGFEMLRRRSLSDAAERFGRGLRLITARAGKPEIYNETITVAFLALIAERLARNPCADWARFIADNGDLADKSVLHRWYEPQELNSDAARKSYIPPRRPLTS